MKVKMIEDVFIEIDGLWKTYKKGITYNLYRGIAEKFYDRCKIISTSPHELNFGNDMVSAEPLTQE